jgi:hypothetical protein
MRKQITTYSLLDFRESLQETLKCKDNALKQFTSHGPGSNGDGGTNASGETVVISTLSLTLVISKLLIHIFYLYSHHL